MPISRLCTPPALLALLSTCAIVASVACNATPPPPTIGTPTSTKTAAVADVPVAALPTGALPGDLAMVVNRSVLVAAASGQRREIAQAPSAGPVYPAHPAWSPDGVSVAYVQKTFSTGVPGVDWGDDVLLVPAAGGAPRMLRKHAQFGEQVQGLAWTPDGGSLLIGRIVTLFKDGQISGLRADIVRIDARAGGQEQVVADGGFMPSLSRDGTRMAYLGLRDLFSEVVVANGDGNARRVLIGADVFVSVMFPRVSPDGTRIVFAAGNPRSQSREYRGGSLLRGVLAWLRPTPAYAHGVPMDIWQVDVASGQMRVIALLAEDEPMPVWSADGKTLVVFATGGIYRMNADGSGLIRLGDGAFGGQVDLR